ncbi:hypothetical protein [Mesorhizobium sp. L-8-3]|uniref:hypothetical protein n=1 Tax=Mesorhizobium sp. L-8-3 TaxID=2744522 RepID=UPI001927689F|nr:hypothetical protein [Mesorhizobium sp. L-8-3]BCH22730.1 hypothetical protein MesoLjLb_25150 [Mesorhizobium sp. L-8-3]
MMFRAIAVAIALFVLTVAASTGLGRTAEWDRYKNGRYAYSIDMPPGFSEIVEADNGDGGKAHSAKGDAELVVWGTILTDLTLREDVTQRILSDEEEGWKLAYSGGNDAGWNWSATREGRILYARAVPLCADEAAYFRLEYPAADRKAFDAVVERLVRSFGSFEGCE